MFMAENMLVAKNMSCAYFVGPIADFIMLRISGAKIQICSLQPLKSSLLD